MRSAQIFIRRRRKKKKKKTPPYCCGGPTKIYGSCCTQHQAVIVLPAPRAAKLVACRDDLSHIDKCFTHTENSKKYRRGIRRRRWACAQGESVVPSTWSIGMSTTVFFYREMTKYRNLILIFKKRRKKNESVNSLTRCVVTSCEKKERKKNPTATDDQSGNPWLSYTFTHARRRWVEGVLRVFCVSDGHQHGMRECARALRHFSQYV